MKAALRAILGGGWYACPNGHSYYVDACGRPTEILKCSECGAEIGGLDHDLIKTNKTMLAQADDTPPGYCLKADADASDRYVTLRELPPSR